MKKFIIAIAVVAVSTMAFGQGVPMLQEGTRALGVSGSIDQVNDEMDVQLNLRGGYFIMDGIEVGATVGARSWDDLTQFSIGGYGVYNLDLGSQIVPYASGSATLNYMDNGNDDDTMFVLSGEGGVKYYIVDSVAIGAGLMVQFATEDIYNNDGDPSDMNAELVLRTTFFF